MDKYIHLILISSDWDDYHRKVFTETVYNKFKSWSDVLIIQFPVSITVNLFIKFKKKLLGYFKGKYRLKEITKGLFLYTPLIFFHQKIWNKINYFKYPDIYLLAAQINKVTEKFGKRKIILWVYLPEHLLLLDKIRYDFLIYDIYDNHIFSTEGNLIRKFETYNNSLIEKSDLIICTSKVMYNNAINYNSNTLYIPNANNAGNSVQMKNDLIKTELSEISQPIIGYVGVIRDWIDFELIEKLLINFKNAKLVFVGPLDKSASKFIKKLSGYENLILAGNKPLNHIPSYLKSFNVGIIPFKLNKFTEGVMPIKFYEYLYAEIPIVTTNLPDLILFQDYIGYSNNHNEFINYCEEALDGKFELKLKDYKKLASQNTWDKRVEKLENSLLKKLGLLSNCNPF